MDHNTPAVSPVAPERSTSTTAPSPFKPASWLEGYVAQQTAAAAAVLILALEEGRDGGPVTSGTGRSGGEFVAELVRLRNFLIGRADFDTMARRGGVAVLRQNCNELSPAACEALVGAVLEIVARVIRQELN